MIKRFIYVISSLLLFAMLFACSGNTNGSTDIDESLEYINIGTAGTGGAYYPIGIALTNILSKELNVESNAQVTGGALENVSLTNSGEVDIAVTQSPMAVAGVNGTDPFSDKHENISTLFNELSQGVFHLVVRNSSDINSVQDLKGKKVVLGPSGGGAINVISDILSLYELSIDDFEGTYVSYSEGVTMLSDNNVDAVIIQSAAPASAITELAASTKDFKIISFEEDKLEELVSEFPYLEQIELPADMYGTNESIKTVYLTNMVIVRNNLSEEFVYNMTKAIFENLEEVQKSHPSAQGLSIEKQANPVAISFHPGAEKYFKEKGIID